MGKALAKLLAKKGAHVVIVARDIQKLEAALHEIKAAASAPATQCFHCISANLTDAAENRRVVEETTRWNNGQPPDIVWANAGASYPHLFLETDLSVLRSQMDTNYWTATYLAHATLTAWTRPSKASSTASTLPRHFIITSSSAAFCGVAGYTPYSPAKSALRSLADNLQSEVQLYNGARYAPASTTGSNPEIKIHIVLPGTILTPGHEHEQTLKHPVTSILEADDPAQTEDQVAQAAVRGLERGDYMITTQWLGHLMRAGALGGSPRNGFGVVDTIVGWVTYVAWLFIGPDMEKKVWKWGKTHGVASPEAFDQHE